MDAVMAALQRLRRKGYERIVIKQEYGLAGRNMIRLLEPELLPTQQKWIQGVLRNHQTVVIEPWLDRVLDYSMQMEMN